MGHGYVLRGVAFVGLLWVACGNPNPAPTNASLPAEPFDLSMLDSAFRPQDAFFEFVNQKWIDANPVPASKSSWGAFHALREESRAALKEILTEAAAKTSGDFAEKTLGLFWKSAMDSAAIAQAQWKPIEPLFLSIRWTNNPRERAQLLASLLRLGVAVPLNMYVDQDLKNAKRYVLYLQQAGLGLPDRGYYVREGKRAEEIRKSYLKYINDLLVSTSMPPETAGKAAKQVFEIEKNLAKASMTLEERRVPEASYHPVSLRDLEKRFPEFSWSTFLAETNARVDSLVLGQPNFLEALNKGMKNQSPEAWEAYLRFHTANSFASYLHPEAESLHFGFYGTELAGKTEMEPRWQRMVGLADELLRDLLGQAYVARHFSEEAKTRAMEMVDNLKHALRARIDRLDWMGDTTRQAAQKKLEKIMVKIGYPDTWRSYQGLTLKDQHLVKNYQEAFGFEWRRMTGKLGKKVDRGEWYMGPQTVNAYYNPGLNEIVFPAAILQPPFFFAEGSDALNFGGIGMVIGHELTHAFDDQGREFDADGNLRAWWTKTDEEKFKAKAHCFVERYNRYEPLPGISINGKLTLGENIADLGGMWIAWDGFMLAQSNEKEVESMGFSPEQWFFISFAQIWRGHDKEAYLEQKLYTDPHSPGKYRVVGVLSNFPPFYKAFGLTQGDGLWLPETEHCTLW